MSKKELTLKMRVLAETKAARLKLEQLSGAVRKLTAGGKRGLDLGLGVLSAGGAVIGRATRGIGLVLALTTALSASTLHASGSYEQLELRLEAVTGSAARAQKVFAQTQAFAAATPFQLDDLVDAKILMEGIGISSQGSLKSAAEAAAAMGRSVTEVSQLLAGLEAEPLRRLGIQAKSEAGRFTFEFRNRMGEIKKISADGAEEARTALLGIFKTKFGGATGKLALSLFGKISTLKDNLKIASAAFGDQLAPFAKRFVDEITKDIQRIGESDGLKVVAKKFAEFVSDGLNTALAAVRSLPALQKDIAAIFTSGPEAMRVVMSAVFETAGRVLFTTIVEGLKASANIFVGIGKIISGAFLEDILNLDIVGMAGVREQMAVDTIANKDFKEGKFIAERYKKANPDIPMSEIYMGDEEALKLYQREARKKVDGMSKSQQIAAAMKSRDSIFDSGVSQLSGAMPDMVAAIGKEIAAGEVRIAAATNAVGANKFSNALALERATSSEPYGPQAPWPQRLTVSMPVASRDALGREFQGGATKNTAVDSFYGGHEKGDSINGGTVINIQNMKVTASNLEKVSQEIQRKSQMLRQSPAGT